MACHVVLRSILQPNYTGKLALPRRKHDDGYRRGGGKAMKDFTHGHAVQFCSIKSRHYQIRQDRTGAVQRLQTVWRRVITR